MYVEILTQALKIWEPDLDEDALISHVRQCRAELPSRDLGAGVFSAEALAAEVSYDRALVCLAARCGIDVSPRRFVHPRIERDRLELQLNALGVELWSEDAGTQNDHQIVVSDGQ